MSSKILVKALRGELDSGFVTMAQLRKEARIAKRRLALLGGLAEVTKRLRETVAEYEAMVKPYNATSTAATEGLDDWLADSVAGVVTWESVEVTFSAGSFRETEKLLLDYVRAVEQLEKGAGDVD